MGVGTHCLSPLSGSVGNAFLAYSVRLRYAVGADHIAAIDSVSRKLMQEGKLPLAVGLMFSLGHSTVVVVDSIAIAATAFALQHHCSRGQDNPVRQDDNDLTASKTAVQTCGMRRGIHEKKHRWSILRARFAVENSYVLYLCVL
jgi:high-affinity nickel-transport protein